MLRCAVRLARVGQKGRWRPGHIYGAIFPGDDASTITIAAKDLPDGGRVVVDVDARKFDVQTRLIKDLCQFTGTPEEWADEALVDQYVVQVFTRLLAD